MPIFSLAVILQETNEFSNGSMELPSITKIGLQVSQTTETVEANTVFTCIPTGHGPILNVTFQAQAILSMDFCAKKRFLFVAMEEMLENIFCPCL